MTRKEWEEENRRFVFELLSKLSLDDLVKLTLHTDSYPNYGGRDVQAMASSFCSEFSELLGDRERLREIRAAARVLGIEL